jgi:Sec7-like guanine-nucleotide exchange factor
MTESINPVVEFLAKLRKDLDDVIERLEKIEKHENKGVNEFFKELNNSLRNKGYSGDWLGNEGKLAVLHEKELVLNREKTKDYLEAIREFRKNIKLLTPDINKDK